MVTANKKVRRWKCKPIQEEKDSDPSQFTIRTFYGPIIECYQKKYVELLDYRYLVGYNVN